MDRQAARQGDEIIHSSVFADITGIVAEGAAYAVAGAMTSTAHGGKGCGTGLREIKATITPSQ